MSAGGPRPRGPPQPRGQPRGGPRGAPRGPPRGPLPPPPPPPSFFPGAASLFEHLDKEVLIVLRDGRHLVGVLRSYDQFSNMVLEDTRERHFVGRMYGDIPLGLYIVRGDSMVLMGEIDPSRDKEGLLEQVSTERILEAQQDVDNGEDFKSPWSTLNEA